MNGLGDGWKEVDGKFTCQIVAGEALIYDVKVFQSEVSKNEWWVGVKPIFADRGVAIPFHSFEEAITAANAIIAGRGVE